MTTISYKISSTTISDINLGQVGPTTQGGLIIDIAHDSLNNLTGFGFYIQPKLSNYAGNDNPIADYNEILDNTSLTFGYFGIGFNLDINGIPNKIVYFTHGRGDSPEHLILLPAIPGVTTRPGVLPSDYSARIKVVSNYPVGLVDGTRHITLMTKFTTSG